MDIKRSRQTFIVRFLNLREQTKEEFEYFDLLDALTVAKKTNIDGQPAISNERFSEELILLLTGGFVYAGQRDEEYPDGDVMIMLHDNDNRTVYGPEVVPFVAGIIPTQSPVAKPRFNRHSEMYTIMKMISPVAEKD